MLNLIHARTFLAVVDTGGFRAAARRLEIAPSTAIDHIEQLERDLKTPLVVRRRGKLQLTPHGTAFTPLARSLVETATAAPALLANGPLRVAAASNVGVYMLQPEFAAFTAETGLAIEPWIGANPAVAARLSQGAADVAVMEWWDERPGFEAVLWRREPMVVIVPRDHPLAACQQIAADRLLGVPILAGESGTGTGTILRRALGGIAHGMTIRPGYGSTEGVLRAVRAGHGVSIVLASAAKEAVASGQVRAVKLAGAELVKEIRVILPDGVNAVSKGRRFCDHLLTSMSR